MRLIIAAILAFVLLLSQSGSADRAHPRLLDSVRPLSQVTLRDFTTNMITYRNICTVSSINAALHLWLSAAHCVLDEDADNAPRPGLTIFGHLVFIVKTDITADLAILLTPDYAAHALRLASNGPLWEDAIRVVGYSFGLPSITITPGTVSNPDGICLPGVASSYMLFTAAVAAGQSGSPVVNSRGQIVSVVQIGCGHDYSPGGGAIYARLKAFAGEYFER